MPIVALDAAVRALASGGLVAIPTETVYGLAANALNGAAVASIFAAKGRPSGHPLILHALDPRPFVEWDARAEKLSAFWPGPLTLVLPARAQAGVAPEVSGGRSTLAVRCPAHPVAQALLAACGFPLAAPSANRFGEVSPTTAAHVLASFPELPVLEGGECSVGVESTIVDLTGPVAAILRPGGIGADAVAVALGEVLGPPGATAAPGTLVAHYAPMARVRVSHAPESLAASLREAGERVVELPRLPEAQYARELYARLRAADEAGATAVVCPWAEGGALAVAVNDRLSRAMATR